MLARIPFATRLFGLAEVLKESIGVFPDGVRRG